MDRNYWGFRINTKLPNYAKYYFGQLERARILRQGWGFEEWHDLRKLSKTAPECVPTEHRPNLRMFNQIKKGDIILVPRIPKWELVSITEATEDWNTGYEFEIDENHEDYGHKFPVTLKTYFSRENRNVDGYIRSTLKCYSRFWNMTRYQGSIKALIDLPPEKLTDYEHREDRFRHVVLGAIDSMGIAERIQQDVSRDVSGTDWEYALVAGFKAIFPNYEVERTGGRNEKEHGTDILITLPGPLQGEQYGIAIQVKDWAGGKADIRSAVNQLSAATEGWQEARSLRIIRKIVILTGIYVPKGERIQHDTVVMGAEGLKDLLRRMALALAASNQN